MAIETKSIAPNTGEKLKAVLDRMTTSGTDDLALSGGLEIVGDPSGGDGVGNRDYNDARYPAQSAQTYTITDGTVTKLRTINLETATDAEFRGLVSALIADLIASGALS